MAGRHCRIEVVDAARHGDDLCRAFVDETPAESWTYLPYGPFDTHDAFRQWLETFCAGDDPMFHAVIDGGRATGLASLMRIIPEMGSIEIGHIHLAPSMRRSIAATECMCLFMKRAFDELGYRRYEWKCDSLNAGSRAAADRLGFTFEGIHRQSVVYKGRSRDTAWYSITDNEWPAVSAGFEAWLAPDNFDETGKQRMKLRELIALPTDGSNE